MLIERPKFELVNHCLIYADKRLRLKARPNTLRLVERLLREPSLRVPKQELLDYIYGRDELGRRSHRLREALDQNVTKLLSRTRSLLSETFDPDKCLFEFLVYNSSEASWDFVHYRSAYFEEHLDSPRYASRVG